MLHDVGREELIKLFWIEEQSSVLFESLVVLLYRDRESRRPSVGEIRRHHLQVDGPVLRRTAQFE